MDHSTVECGCGFAASGPDQDKLTLVLQSHECSQEPGGSTPWYGWIFSFWGWALIGTIGVVATILIRPELWTSR